MVQKEFKTLKHCYSLMKLYVNAERIPKRIIICRPLQKLKPVFLMSRGTQNKTQRS